MDEGVDRELERAAHELVTLARSAHQNARAPEAARLLDAAALCAERAGAKALASEARRLAAVQAYSAGEIESAAREFGRAAALARAAGDAHAALRSEASLAFVDYDRGDPVAAIERLDGVEREVRASRPDARRRDLEALVLGYRGNVARQQGALELASARYREAITHAEAPSIRVTFEMDLAATELAAGDSALALARIERIGGELPGGPTPPDTREMLAPLIAHYRALALLGRGQRVDIEIGDRPSLHAIRRLLWDATGGGRHRASIDAPLELRLGRLADETRGIQGTEHARLGLRIVRALAGDGVDARVLIPRGGGAILAARTVDLETRPSLRRVLALLAERHLAAPDRLVTLSEIIAAGWPEERIAPAAARNRAHVALATLRSLGLAGALQRERGGYRLDPARARVA